MTSVNVCKCCGKKLVPLREKFEQPFPTEGTKDQAPNIPIVWLFLIIRLELLKKRNWCFILPKDSCTPDSDKRYEICRLINSSPYSAAENILYALLEDYDLVEEWGPTMKTYNGYRRLAKTTDPQELINFLHKDFDGPKLGKRNRDSDDETSEQGRYRRTGWRFDDA